MPERRYNEDEVAEIFARASEKEQAEQAERKQLSSSEGLTLTELQRIGREAGMSAELVAQAARAIDEPRAPAPPVFLGLPVGVARTVRLDRRLTDAEWERLVVDLRETFDARGVVRTEGSLRSWSNGNLHVLVEPDGDGQRVRFRTIKGSARPQMFAGMAVVAASIVSAVPALAAGGGLAEVTAFLPLFAAGAGMFALSALQLPRWARLRQRQMDELADRLTEPSPE